MRGSGSAQRIQNNLQHGFGLLQHVVVPEPHNADAQPGEGLFTPLVVGALLGVLAAIELDGQMLFRTIKIENEIFHRVLAAEFVAEEAPVTQQMPEP